MIRMFASHKDPLLDGLLHFKGCDGRYYSTRGYLVTKAWGESTSLSGRRAFDNVKPIPLGKAIEKKIASGVLKSKYNSF
jgi:hypothetical protein